MKYVGKGIVKKDAKALLSGKAVYTDDLAPSDALTVKLLRSPHAFARIRDIDVSKAMLVPGVETVISYRDVPRKRFTLAGQTFPEPSPYDRLILDEYVRFEGDPVAIVAGRDEKCCIRAMKLIKVEYEVLEPVLDFRKSKDNSILVHPEADFLGHTELGTDNMRNLCASDFSEEGDVDRILSECEHVVEGSYHIKAVNQAMMEPFTAYSFMDTYGRLNIVSSTQVPFHVRRNVAHALDIPKSKVRVVKPRIGGGFGAKQTAVMEIYPAAVTWFTGKPAHLIFTREECFINGSPRHEMEVTVKLGADGDGKFRAVDLYTLSNTGAYGEHGPTTVGLTGTKSLSLYSGFEAHRFSYDVVYTNVLSAGAYRGYGATQGIFALESAVNEMAERLGMDPIKLREKNMVHEGDVLTHYYGETASTCALDRCVARVKEMIGWDEKYPCREVAPGRVRAVGMGMAMQGSGISGVDVGSVQIKLNDDGFYSLLLGCSDMGTGCDTILSQMAADTLGCDIDQIVVYGVDTDQSPYDSGSYASSTTYVTGGAVVAACEQMKKKIVSCASELLGRDKEELSFDGEKVFAADDEDICISLADMVTSLQAGSAGVLCAQSSNTSPVSPPPFMAGAAEIEIDLETGKITPVNFAACIDCGTVINENLARVQAEGGIGQGIGMTLYEDVRYTDKGRMMTRNLMQYKIPSRMDMPPIHVEFEQTYEKTGPFGAKSIGEVVINTPAPAIADAVYNATGLRFRTLPITAEMVLKGLKEKGSR
ncbi:MAG: molybdopterin-dependent oxidoreductase [Firmicutes bacterium]|nr:molybdopterin-dependent oxidoreductase [Bacillota bacterium]